MDRDHKTLLMSQIQANEQSCSSPMSIAIMHLVPDLLQMQFIVFEEGQNIHLLEKA